MNKKAPVALEVIANEPEIAWEEVCVSTFRNLPYVQIAGDFLTLAQTRALLVVVDNAQEHSKTASTPREKAWSVNGLVIESGTSDNPSLYINDSEYSPEYIQKVAHILKEACDYVESWSPASVLQSVG